jgi:uncharacterized protein YutE (UPF0331/DUF86 family)
VERALQIAIEAILDCARLLVIAEEWTLPKSEPHAVELLADHGVITQELCKRCLSAKGFRNVLVHEYEEIDPKRVYSYLQDGFSDIEEFARSLAQYLTGKDV